MLAADDCNTAENNIADSEGGGDNVMLVVWMIVTVMMIMSDKNDVLMN